VVMGGLEPSTYGL